jgi:hypothetical protein
MRRRKRRSRSKIIRFCSSPVCLGASTHDRLTANERGAADTIHEQPLPLRFVRAHGLPPLGVVCDESTGASRDALLISSLGPGTGWHGTLVQSRTRAHHGPGGALTCELAEEQCFISFRVRPLTLGRLAVVMDWRWWWWWGHDARDAQPDARTSARRCRHPGGQKRTPSTFLKHFDWRSFTSVQYVASSTACGNVDGQMLSLCGSRSGRAMA